MTTLVCTATRRGAADAAERRDPPSCLMTGQETPAQLLAQKASTIKQEDLLLIQFFKNHNLFIPNELQIKTEQQREGIWCQWRHRAEQTCVSLLCEQISFSGHWLGTTSVEDPRPRYWPGPVQSGGELSSSCPRSQPGCQAARGQRAAVKEEGGGGLSTVVRA